MRKGETGPDEATAFLNARLIDPASGKDEPGGLLVKDGVIADLGAKLRRNAPDRARVIDCKGHVLCPGLIDMQVFTGEPGQEHRETLKTASQAAAAGGVTTIVVMPDTEPVIDQVALVDFIQRRARDNAVVHVHVMAAMTRGLKGQEMTEIGLLQRAGAIAFTNGKASVSNARVMRNVLLYAKDFGALIVHHTEDPHLTDGTVMNSGEVATRLGLPGVNKAAETIVLERDLRLVEITGGRYHAAQVTCAESLAVMRAAKARKLPVTCGVSINHLTLNENDIGPYRTFFRLRPPLRVGGRPHGHGARTGGRRDRCDRLEPRSTGCRHQAPPLRRGSRRRHRPGDAARGGAAPLPQRRDRPAAAAEGHDRQSGQAVRAARRTPGEGRAGRSDPGRPRAALGGGQGGDSRHARRTRRSTRARCRGACS